MSATTRSGDPETSFEAAASVRDLSERQWCILTLFQMYGPMTDQELVARYEWATGHFPRTFAKQSESGLRTRRSELVALGKVEFSGEWALTSGGRRSRIWRAL